MAGGGGQLRRREVPWCALILVGGSLLCHTLVLVGNLQCASAMESIGKSTAGWSKVGLGLSRAFQVELDQVMDKVAKQLLDSMKHIAVVQTLLDHVVSMAGSSTEEHVEKQTELALLQIGNGNATDHSATFERIVPIILEGIDKVVATGIEMLNNVMQKLLLKLKPALTQVGEWLLKFGPKIQAAIESFSISLDKVQKIFDQIMAQINGKGEGEAAMLHETFTLFDVGKTGFVRAEDLHTVGELFSIGALQGTKPEELVKKYDADGDNQLSKPEMALFVHDPSIPDSLSVVLRTYAKKLSEVGGNVGAARMRDELALAVVTYFQLVCAKNMTKVGWIADTLGNASLPLDFTSAVFAQLCLSEGSPDVLTNQDIGGIVISTMFYMHYNHTLKALNNMANVTYWIINGFPPLDQPRCVKRVTEWVAEARAKNLTEAQAQKRIALLAADGTVSVASLSDGDSLLSVMDMDVLEAMPARAESMAMANVKNYLLKRQYEHAAERAALFRTKTSRDLLMHLTGGQGASDVKNPNAERAIHAGQKAKPETLRFAQYLAANATITADRLQAMSFAYSSTSSSALDSFATKIQGMVKKMQSFLEMMMKWASPAGIERLDKTVSDFTTFARTELMKIVRTKVEALVGQNIPRLSKAFDAAVDKASDELGHKIGKALGPPLQRALKGPLSDVAGSVLNDTDAGAVVGEELAPLIGEAIGNRTGDYLADELGDVLDLLINRALDRAEEKLNHTHHVTKPAFIQESVFFMNSTEKEDMEEEDDPSSGAFGTMVTVLNMLNTLLPTATNTLKFARTEVSKASANLDSVFNIFEVKGPAIFNVTAQLYAMLWVLWFAFLLPLTLFNLYYAFWASGWFGGPQPIMDDEDVEPPKTFVDRIRTCCNSCCTCMAYYHDLQCCFWGFIILMQVVVMLIFIISIVLCILAGVKAFVLSGCAQVFILRDNSVCKETVSALRNFLATFFVKDAVEELDDVCPRNDLLTCSIIESKMQSSVILTTVFSFLATLLSLQMLIEAAVLHEQARYRRMFNKMCLEDDALQASKGEDMPRA